MTGRSAGRRLRPFALLLVPAGAIALAFLVVPVVALVVRDSPGRLLDQAHSHVVGQALMVTLRTNSIAFGLTLLVGTPAAYLVARRRFPGRTLVITLVELPIVLPPAVAGIALLVTFGRLGLLGRHLSAWGIDIGFTQTAVVLAVMFVAGPLYLRQAISSFESVDQNLILAARTLGAGPGRAFWRVALPLASGGLGAGAAICLARGIGEFGATLMFAGSLRGVTQTLSLAIYDAFDTDFDAAIAIGVLLVVVSAVVLLVVKAISWRVSRSTSPFRFGTSSSVSPSR
jgi:molybdate transport system permease protein